MGITGGIRLGRRARPAAARVLIISRWIEACSAGENTCAGGGGLGSAVDEG